MAAAWLMPYPIDFSDALAAGALVLVGGTRFRASRLPFGKPTA
jgi:hypothetical protein